MLVMYAVRLSQSVGNLVFLQQNELQDNLLTNTHQWALMTAQGLWSQGAACIIPADN